MTAAHPVLEARALRMTFYDRNRADLLALDGMSLQVADGEYLAIVGPSGAQCVEGSPA